MPLNQVGKFREVNVASTLALARQVAWVGVKRVIFVSTIPVNANVTTLDHPFTAEDTSSPHDA